MKKTFTFQSNLFSVIRTLLLFVFSLNITSYCDTQIADNHEIVKAKLILEPPVIPFYKFARLTICVETTKDTPVEFPKITNVMEGLTLSELTNIPEITNLDNGKLIHRASYKLDATLPGLYPIKPISIKFGSNGLLTIPGIILQVREPTEEEIQALAYFAPDAEPIIPVKPFWQNPYVILMLFLLLITISSLIIALLRRRKKQNVTQPSPWLIAYQRLRQLQRKQLLSLEKHDAFYVELSDILRQYIEARFHIHAPEQTTPEFLEETQKQNLLIPEHQQLLANFLKHCDLVKFAKYQPSIEEMKQAFAHVLQFIDETVPLTIIQTETT